MPIGTARRPRTSPLVAVAVAVLAAVLLLGAWPASSHAAACEGVLVRVERSTSAITERCVTGAAPSDGLDALDRAGFDVQFVPGQPGFVCTIDGHPDPCNGAPADAYWSYWHAAPGDAGWTYSSRGGASRTPPPGSADAWVFGDGSRPPSTPPPPAPTPSPSPTSPPASDDGTSGGGSSSRPDPGRSSAAGSSEGSSGGSGRAPDPDPTPRPSADPDPTPDDATDRPSADPDTDTAPTDASDDTASDTDVTEDLEVEDASSRTDDTTDDTTDGADGAADEDPASVAAGDEVTVPAGGRSATGAVVGGLLVAGLAGAGLLRARRRSDHLDAT